MISVHLQEHRCDNCHRLFFKGFIGLGFVEVKCSRCGEICILNSFETLLNGKKNIYIIVYDSAGQIIATSKSAANILGYCKQEFDSQTNFIHAIDPDIELPEITDNNPSVEDLKLWDIAHDSLSTSVGHISKDGSVISSTAQYFPIASHDTIYTIGVFTLA